jgi:phosphoribosyl-ATP pyrophosphohydrolase/phosphoribosyl-AMP cyclohydrolase
MEQKNIVATLFLKDGKAVKSKSDFTEVGDVYELCRIYNDSGIDKIVIFDLSTDDDEHERNLHTIRNLNRNLEIKTCAGGNISRFEDVRKILYSGCMQVLLNGSKPGCAEIAKEASTVFGKDRVVLSVNDNIDFIFKNRRTITECFHEVLVRSADMLDAIENLTDVQYVVTLREYDFDNMVKLLKRKNIRGIAGPFINDTGTDIMKLKTQLSEAGIKMDNFAPDLQWSDLKLNSDGMVPVIVQDYRTNEVLMLAYMNEEAFNTTINIGKMTYYSRSRNELWTKGLTSGHIQYVKSLTADCDFDTILAKVSQVGAACHTGNRSCFFNKIVQKEYIEKNLLKILDGVYERIKDCKEHPRVGSYTTTLLDKGEDEILRKLGDECLALIIASKNPDKEEIKKKISDYLYLCMLLMVEKGISWEEIVNEISQL